MTWKLNLMMDGLEMRESSNDCDKQARKRTE